MSPQSINVPKQSANFKGNIPVSIGATHWCHWSWQSFPSDAWHWQTPTLGEASWTPMGWREEWERKMIELLATSEQHFSNVLDTLTVLGDGYGWFQQTNLEQKRVERLALSVSKRLEIWLHGIDKPWSYCGWLRIPAPPKKGWLKPNKTIGCLHLFTAYQLLIWISSIIFHPQYEIKSVPFSSTESEQPGSTCPRELRKSSAGETSKARRIILGIIQLVGS